jgi:hypothetical protein
MINIQVCDNHILYSLVFFLQFIDPDLGIIDVDAPISQFDEGNLVLAVSFMEMNMGIDVPDEYLLCNKTLRQLADEIRLLPQLTDSDFRKKLLLLKAAMGSN